MHRKQLIWIGSSRKDLLNLPDDIKRTMGYALHRAQVGDRYEGVKVLKGFGNADVIEIIDSGASGSYRVVYTVRMPEVIFVLHAFQKKSKQGIKTPLEEMHLVKSRLKQAEELYKELFNKK
jgi:phage-related protein